MITKTDRKFMMLQKMITRLKKQNAKLTGVAAAKEDTITIYRGQIQRMMDRIRGNGAKAPVPAEYQESYTYALQYVTNNKYRDKSEISIFKNPGTIDKPNDQKRGALVVDWKVTRIDEDLYDLEFEKEWVY